MRDPSWWRGEVYELLARHAATFCIYQLNGVISPREITSELIYVRLHGPDGPYRGGYDQNGHAARDALRMRGMIPSDLL